MYDEENRLIEVTEGGNTVTFGSSDGGRAGACPATRRAANPFGVLSRVAWAQPLSVLLIVALFVGSTVPCDATPTYEPVFYYYLSDHLGSATILTDRAGELVDHYGYTAFGKEHYNANDIGPGLDIRHLVAGRF